jgi:hypothetical protein
MNYKIEKQNDDYYVIGLKIGVSPNCLLYFKNNNGIFTTIIDCSDAMLYAINDLLRVHENLKDGDILETETFGTFQCVGRQALLMTKAQTNNIEDDMLEDGYGLQSL